MVRGWFRRHGQGFTPTLTGPAGGASSAHDAAAALELDAVPFGRVLSCRREGTGLLSTRVTF